MIYTVEANSPWDAISKFPKIGSPHPDKPELVVSSYEAVQVAPGVFRVEVRYEKV